LKRFQLHGISLTMSLGVHNAELMVMAQRPSEAVFGGRRRQTMVGVGSYAVTIQPWRCGLQTDQRALARPKLVVPLWLS
jgi:hypothetical protein